MVESSPAPEPPLKTDMVSRSATMNPTIPSFAYNMTSGFYTPLIEQASVGYRKLSQHMLIKFNNWFFISNKSS